MTTCALVFGLGDLAMRIAERLTSARTVDRLVLAGRNLARGRAYAQLLAASDGVGVEVYELDVLNVAACMRVLRAAQPDVVVQCACFVSPWTVAGLHSKAGEAMRRIGFGAQLPFQMPCLRSVMTAVRELGCTAPVVNCSYPDATHAVLAGEGLEPTIGVGNAAMMQLYLEEVLRREARPGLVRLVAHHAHTVPVLTQKALAPELLPWVFIGDEGAPEHALSTHAPSIEWSIATNVLSAATAVRAIRALLPHAPSVRLSSPGPLGLPGGYPVIVSSQRILLDLPKTISRDEAIAHNQVVARTEGIADIRDGIATWTDEAATVLRELGSELARPFDCRNTLLHARGLASALGLTS